VRRSDSERSEPTGNGAATKSVTPAAATVFNDASVDYVIALGSLPQPLVGPQTVQAVVTNRGVNALSNLPVTLNRNGA